MSIKKDEKSAGENLKRGGKKPNGKHEWNLHPLKGTVIDDGYKDKESSKKRLQGEDKEKLANQIHSATDENDERVADKIQNSKD